MVMKKYIINYNGFEMMEFLVVFLKKKVALSGRHLF